MSPFSLADVLRRHPQFELRRQLGVGGFGYVYEALDRTRGAVVALKVLRQSDASSLLGFKQEFRTLAELSHPNLVRLYELTIAPDLCFFTMELIEGVNALEYVQGQGGEVPPLPGRQSPGASSIPGPLSETLQRPLTPESRSSPSPSELEPGTGNGSSRSETRTNAVFDEGRVRQILFQVASALVYLHESGKLHRDIKPSNILVTREGRVVLLDFGLAAELQGNSTHHTSALVGTPHYMAPEHALGRASPASDWYSVGVALYEMLTGTLPHTGQAIEVILSKQQNEARSARSVNDRVPRGLDELCSRLLRRDPSERPTGREVLDLLEKQGSTHPPPRGTVGPAIQKSVPFVGRDAELRALDEAYDASRGGHAAVVLIHAKSAMGKSTLVRHFLTRLHERNPEALALAGRCHPQESVPYKAFDAIIDALTRDLKRRKDEEVAGFVPRNAASLIRMFPVLGEVRLFAEAPQRDAFHEPAEQRRRAFDAARDLLVRVAERRPLVLFVDDLQWGDAESAYLLSEVLRPPDGPALVFIAAYRSDEEATSPCLSAWLPVVRREFEGGLLREIPLGPLTPSQAEALATAILAGRAAPPGDRPRAIAREAEGQPMFVSELAHYEKEHGAGVAEAAIPDVSLDGFIRTRAEMLSPTALGLLKLVAVAKQPVSRTLVESCFPGLDDALGAWQALGAGRWVRARGTSGRDFVEAYHDRVREVVASLIAPEQRQQLHAALGAAMEGTGGYDAETLATHFLGGGDTQKAAGYAEAAARAATEVLAFDRAARLYRMALDHGPSGSSSRSTLEEALGDALSMAGRCAEAAEAYLRAVEVVEPDHALELRRRAAQQLLIAGQIDGGMSTIKKVLEQVGVGYPSSNVETVARMAWYWLVRSWRQRRSLASRPSPTQVDILRLDALHVAAHFLGVADPLPGVYFSRRHAACALAVNDASRASRALASEMVYQAVNGGEESSRAERRIQQRARALAEGSKDPLALAFMELAEGGAAYLHFRWREAAAHFGRAEDFFRERKGAFWEMNIIQMYRMLIHRECGQWRTLVQYYPDLVADARARGDLYAETQIVTASGHIPHVLADDGEAGCREIREGIARWARPVFDQLRAQATVGLALPVLYRDSGVGPEALDTLDKAFVDLRRTGMMFAGMGRILYYELVGRGVLAKACSVAGSERRDLASRAVRLAKKLEAERVRWAAAHAALIQAGAAAVAGDPVAASIWLDRAESGFTELGIGLLAAVTRWRKGQLIGGDTGAAMVRETLKVVAAEGAKNPSRLASSLAPGFPS